MDSENVMAAFDKIFTSSRIYGRNVFIIGRDKINRAIKQNINEYYLEYKGELPLFAFAYMGEEMNEGFVITNYRIIWRYSDGDYCGDVDLEDIRRVEIGRSVLARVMKIIDFTGKKYPDIYLTGMDSEEEFVNNLNEFIAVINGVDDIDDWSRPINTPVNKSAPRSQVSTADVNKLANFVVQTFARGEFMFDRYIYPVGRDEKSNDKINKACTAYASLKDGEFPLVCCDITAFGGAEDVLLITNFGIYVHNPFDNVQHFPYQSISSIEAKGMLVKDIYINGFKVESPAGNFK